MLTSQEIQSILDDAVLDCRAYCREGQLANYIPKLAEANPGVLGLCLLSPTGELWHSGEWSYNVTIQSISKVAIFLQLLVEMPMSQITQHLSFNATADGFNSLSDLERYNQHRPLNPYVNSGAIVSLSLLQGSTQERFEKVFALTKAACHNEYLVVDEEVYQSEKIHGDKNRAITYYLKSAGIIDDMDVEDLLDSYFRICSIRVNCRDLAHFASELSPDPEEKTVVSREYLHIARAVMASCGMYNQSGEFLVRTGLPSKSGVSGGIMASCANGYGLGVISPPLNSYSNSAAGIHLLEQLSHKLPFLRLL
ncbi:MAG: glutaminase A [Firmicutes bacterium]|nr:glutaminase A [Bacillota bacterium]